VDFEYDPAKSQANKAKHGIDFEEAQALWTDPNRVEFVARFQDEERTGTVALFDRKLWTAISTERGEKTRIISVRRAREYEKELYQGGGV
jgi:uncharacterized protein